MSTSIATTPEQQELATTAKRFLKDKVSMETVRELMATDAGVDDGLWQEIAQLGWCSLAIPEEFGGAGYSWAETAVVMEEAGRALLPGPLLSSAVVATSVLLEGGNADQKKTHLPVLASGERRATLAVLPPQAADTMLSAARRDGGWTLTGTASYVLDGHTADILIIAARVGDTPDELALFIVEADADGLERTPIDTLDQTRKLASVTCDGVDVGEDALLGDGSGTDGTHILAAAEPVIVSMLAIEQVGAATEAFERTLAYSTERKQFGRAIGSFQAIKHRIAELLVDLEAARSVAYHAATTLAAGDADELAIAAPMAGAYCGEVFEHIAGEMIQIHGGIGFTWEHDAHLFFKRAKSTKLLFGSPKDHRSLLADRLGL